MAFKKSFHKWDSESGSISVVMRKSQVVLEISGIICLPKFIIANLV